jgi:hypothetical protein
VKTLVSLYAAVGGAQQQLLQRKSGVQLLVSCGGGRRLADGLRKQHVSTIRLPVLETLEDFFAILDCT